MKVRNTINMRFSNVLNYRKLESDFSNFPIHNYKAFVELNSFSKKDNSLSFDFKYNEFKRKINVKYENCIFVDITLKENLTISSLEDAILDYNIKINTLSEMKRLSRSKKVTSNTMYIVNNLNRMLKYNKDKIFNDILDLISYVQYSFLNKEYVLDNHDNDIHINNTKTDKKLQSNTINKYTLVTNKSFEDIINSNLQFDSLYKRSINRKTDSWSVRGHYRTYKSGKKVWVNSFTKGNKNKNIEMNYVLNN